jgi:N utilization substance protein B
MPHAKAPRALSRQRSLARKLALQALYRWQINECSWQDLVQEFSTTEDMPRADGEYFRALLAGICAGRTALDARLAELLDRSPELLDPVEHAALLIGVYELEQRLDVPYQVAISEAVILAKRFGATDGHKYVNAVLERAARALRPQEH